MVDWRFVLGCYRTWTFGIKSNSETCVLRGFPVKTCELAHRAPIGLRLRSSLVCE